LVDLGGRGRRRLGRARRQPRGVRRLVAGTPPRVARYAWPAGVAGAGLAWYAADSLRHRREGGHGYRLHGAEELDPAGDGFMRAAEALTSAPISWGSEVELLINGDRIFPVMLETVRDAEKTICLTTYAWWRGEIAHEMADALIERVRAGVECNVIIDAMGGILLEREVLRRMLDAGVRVVRFRPPKPYAVKRLENRTHRKLLIADGRVGMTGGVGIAEEWTGDAQDPDHWRDTHVRVRGPVVRGLLGAFADNWLEATGEVLIGDGYLPELPEKDDGGPMMVVRSSAGVGDSNAEALYYLAIAAARRTLDLTAAYFVPRPAFTEALCEAASRGVRVRVLVPGPHIDKSVVRVAGRAAYDDLLACGVEVHEYAPTMLHAKTMVVDGVWSSVGSVNFDNRSFQLHDEATLCVRSEAFAAELTEQFERDLGDAEAIVPGRWTRRGARRRAAETATRLARREL
jgi:cardiolipin synthase